MSTVNQMNSSHSSSDLLLKDSLFYLLRNVPEILKSFPTAFFSYSVRTNSLKLWQLTIIDLKLNNYEPSRSSNFVNRWEESEKCDQKAYFPAFIVFH